MTIDELKHYCNAEFDNIEKVLNELFSVYRKDKTDYTLAEQAAVSAFIVNIYSGFESILKQILKFDKLDIADSPMWHEKVLRKAGEIGILTPEFFQVFSKYLSFRNYFIYSYVFNIDWKETTVLADTVKELVEKFRAEIFEYINTI